MDSHKPSAAPARVVKVRCRPTDYSGMLSIKSGRSDRSDTNLHSEHKEHGWALRAIGQDLADILPESLEIEFTGQFYVVRGQGKTGRAPAVKKTGAVGKLLGKLKSDEQKRNPKEQQAVPFERTYPLAKIHLLGEQGKSQRRDSPLSPDIYVLGERLRAVGKIIEAEGGQLIRLRMDEYRVAFKYRDSKGEFHEEEHTTPELYRSQKKSHTRRLAGKERDTWEKVRK